MNDHGGFPPIVTVLLFLVVIATAVIVGWWFVRVHSSAVSRPVLSLSGGIYIANGYAYFTLRNDGTVDFSDRVCIVAPSGQDCTPSAVDVPAGGSAPVEIPLNSINVPAGAMSIEVVIRPLGAGEIKAVAEVVRG